MCTEFVEERKDLIRAIPKDRKLSELPTPKRVRDKLLNGLG